MSNRSAARKLAQESLASGDALGWFERLYSQAEGDHSMVPWADMVVNPNLLEWLKRTQVDGAGKNALVVGCGLGDDAEALAHLGFHVVAFDISATAIGWCRKRFASSSVEYVVADLFAPPSAWGGAFDLVVEAYTLQSLPGEFRSRACQQFARLVAPGGTFLVITRGREADEDPGQLPWPLVRAELDLFANQGLSEVKFEDYVDREQPPVRRFRVEYRKR